MYRERMASGTAPATKPVAPTPADASGATVTASKAPRGGPTLDDAKAAADVLVERGAELVMLYGSVARGEQRRFSDIDLVAVFPDIDYRSRVKATIELEAAAGKASGRLVQVLVTDRAEWRVQTEQVTTSFASAISGDLRVLADFRPLGEQAWERTDWDKEQVMAASDDEHAEQRLDTAGRLLVRLRGQLSPSSAELDAEDANSPDATELREERLIGACATAHVAIENSLKAVGAMATIDALTMWSHDVGKVADKLVDELGDDGEAMRTLLASAPELVKAPGYITMWRTIGTYGTGTDGLTAADLASPAFTAAISTIAADVASAAASWCARQGLDAPAATARITRETPKVHTAAQSLHDLP